MAIDRKKSNAPASAKLANRVIPNEDGLFYGVIQSSGFETAIQKSKFRGDSDDENQYERFAMDIVFKGATAPILIHVYTGTVVNPDPVKIENKGRGKNKEVAIYNKFTTLLIALGYVDKDKLDTLTQTDVDVINEKLCDLAGLEISCDINKEDSEGKPSQFYNVVISSIHFAGVLEKSE
jgi:hypothetical protein